MPEPKLAGGARPRSAVVDATGGPEARVILTPPDGEPAAVFGRHAAGVVSLSHDYPDLAVAPGWAAAGRGWEGVVASVNGRTLTLEVTP